MAIKVTLRERIISKGRKSLYLDFYPAIPHQKTGKPKRREYLGLYLIIDKAMVKKELDKKRRNGENTDKLLSLYKELKPLSPIDKQHNAETLKIAESIKQKKENILNKPEIYNEYEKEQLRIKKLGEQCFITYFRKLTDKKKESNRNSWLSALNYLEKFTNGNLKFADLNESCLEEFKEYLLTTHSIRSNKTKLSQNSALSYFNKVKAALKQAYKEGMLQTDLNSLVAPIKEAETRREYLTLDELNRLVQTPCNDPLLKRTALFSALTGMAHKEIENLSWQDISFINDKGYLILTKRQKTQRDNYLPISEQAYSLTKGTENPNDMPPDEKVFKGLKYSAFHNKNLTQWIKSAGITKKITFHCFRHTFATLQLFNGTDIYTVSKMLGHKDLKTTQVYAKIVDDAKRKAANKIQLHL